MENQSKINEKEKIKFFFDMLETKIREMKTNEAIFAPERHINTIEKFLNEKGFKVESVHQSDKVNIKIATKGDIEIYLIMYPHEAWVVKSCNIVLKAIKSVYIYKALSRDIKYRYHIAEFLYSFEK